MTDEHNASLIWKWLRRLFKKRPDGGVRRASWPTIEQINLLPWFKGLSRHDIVVITTREGARRAYNELMRVETVGFDTESKPTFIKGQKSNGPHVVQFSTLERAYVFMLHEAECRQIVGALIESPALKKVGFGLDDDLKRIHKKLNVQPREIVDLETLFATQGHGRGVGVKVAVALAFNRRFRKSRRASTSNWGARHLSDAQLLYAANDAYAPIKVFHALTSS
jgi:ribonuclease D